MPPVEHVIRAHDGIDLVSRRFEPVDPCADRRSLVIVHGASEHGRRYDHVARLFADRGWMVVVDEVALMTRQADPLIHRSVTCGWFFQMKAALKAVWDDVGKLHMPVLVAQGGADRIVDPHVAAPWLKKVPSIDKELKWFPEHYHELHNEPDWLDVMNCVADWLEERVKCGPDVATQRVGSEIPVS